jgi:hypothetical protein
MSKPVHIITMQNTSEWFFKPKEMFFGYIIRTGKFMFEKREEFDILRNAKSLTVFSYFNACSLQRKIEKNSFDPKNKVIYFRYDEDIPYEIIQIYKHRMMTTICRYCDLKKIVYDLIKLVSLDKILFNDEYVEWMDRTVEEAGPIPDEERSKLKTFLNLFSNSYITTFLSISYKHDIQKMYDDREKIVYKLLEMKYLNDIGMVKII